jgi:hypothetical protein
MESETPEQAKIAGETERERAERHVAMLRELGRVGMDLIHGIRDAMAEDPGRVAELAMPYARVAAAVRQSVAHEAKLAAELGESERKAAEPEQPSRVQQAYRRLEMQRQIERVVRLMGAPDIRFKDTQALLVDLYLRLRAYAAEDQPEGRSLNLIFAELCVDAGIKPVFNLWPEDGDEEGEAEAEPSEESGSGDAAAEETAPAPASGFPQPVPGDDLPDRPGAADPAIPPRPG